MVFRLAFTLLFSSWLVACSGMPAQQDLSRRTNIQDDQPLPPKGDSKDDKKGDTDPQVVEHNWIVGLNWRSGPNGTVEVAKVTNDQAIPTFKTEAHIPYPMRAAVHKASTTLYVLRFSEKWRNIDSDRDLGVYAFRMHPSTGKLFDLESDNEPHIRIEAPENSILFGRDIRVHPSGSHLCLSYFADKIVDNELTVEKKPVQGVRCFRISPQTGALSEISGPAFETTYAIDLEFFDQGRILVAADWGYGGNVLGNLHVFRFDAANDQFTHVKSFDAAEEYNEVVRFHSIRRHPSNDKLAYIASFDRSRQETNWTSPASVRAFQFAVSGASATVQEVSELNRDVDWFPQHLRLSPTGKFLLIPSATAGHYENGNPTVTDHELAMVELTLEGWFRNFQDPQALEMETRPIWDIVPLKNGSSYYLGSQMPNGLTTGALSLFRVDESSRSLEKLDEIDELPFGIRSMLQFQFVTSSAQ